MAEITKSLYLGTLKDAAYNLAVEESLISSCQDHEIILFLWQNSDTVVIGKHQNPYRECNLDLMQQNKVTLIRRKSGGGAVYHDLGNLNFSFIAHNSRYDLEKQFSVILKGLRYAGIHGEVNGRNDMVIDGKKFSGNAFIHHQDFTCHHGTLLIESQLSDLGKYLTPPKLKLEAKGIGSVRSRVTNLKAYNPAITVDTIANDLIRAFDASYDGTLRHKCMPVSDALEALIASYKQWEWNYGESPKYDISYSGKFSWGCFGIDLRVRAGKIQGCKINSDTLLEMPFTEFQGALEGIQPRNEAIKEIVHAIFEDPTARDDIMSLFHTVPSPNRIEWTTTP